jgi:cbb3-type cytochrome oxidase subunit 1
MYFFVRFNGFVTIVLGILLMFFGVGAVIYGFVQNAALIDLVNNYWLASSNIRLLDARFYMAVIGLVLFLAGMGVSAWGQLLMVFADVASNTRESNVILRGMRNQG